MESTSAEVPKERRVEYLRYCVRQYQRIYEYVIYCHYNFKFVLNLLFYFVIDTCKKWMIYLDKLVYHNSY